MEDRTFVAFHRNLCAARRRPSPEQVDELRVLAEWNDIEGSERMTYRQLCKALDRKVDEQTQEREEEIGQCVDNTISLESIANIPAPYFFSYRHNGQIRCDDVRDLFEFLHHDRMAQNRRTAHARDPYDRTPLPLNIVNAIILKYHQVIPAIHPTMEINNVSADEEEQAQPIPFGDIPARVTRSSTNYL